MTNDVEIGAIERLRLRGNLLSAVIKLLYAFLAGYSIEKKIGLSFGFINSIRFHFDSEKCLNYPFLNNFLVYILGNLKLKLKCFSKPKYFY